MRSKTLKMRLGISCETERFCQFFFVFFCGNKPTNEYLYRVTRLIKVSKSQKPPTHHHTASNSSSFSLPAILPPSTTPKITAAHAELQACEAHLAQKEMELTSRRASAVQDGLAVRCRGLVDCAWVWGEMGKDGLAMLEGTRALPEGAGGMFSKPLPDITGTSRPSSDLSFLAPSLGSGSGNTTPVRLSMQYLALSTQIHPISTSNGTKQSLKIPPAHSISELALPTSDDSPSNAQTLVIVATPQPFSTFIQPEESNHDHDDHGHETPVQDSSEQQQQQQPDENQGRRSSSTEEERPLRLVENVRFANMTPSASVESHESSKWYSIRRGGIGEETYPKKTRDRKGSGFLGSLRGLFRHGGPDGDGYAGAEGDGERRKLSKGREAKWRTRTERNLKALGGGESSGEEGVGGSSLVRTTTPSPSPFPPPKSPGGGSGRRLKKGRSRRVTAIAAVRPVEKEGRESFDRGWVSDEGGATSSLAKLGGGKGEEEEEEEKTKGGANAHVKKHRRAMSIDGRSTLPFGPLPQVPEDPSQRNGWRKTGTVVHPHKSTGEGSMSLMTIVEDVSRQNREGWDVSGSVGESMNVEGTGKEIEVVRGVQLRDGEVPKPDPVLPDETSGEETPSKPAKLPLRSALRNTSRTPSPPPPPVPAKTKRDKGKGRERERENGKGKSKEKEKENENGVNGEGEEEGDSESSYETGNEMFGEEGEEEETEVEVEVGKPLPQQGVSGSSDNIHQHTPPRSESPHQEHEQEREQGQGQELEHEHEHEHERERGQDQEPDQPRSSSERSEDTASTQTQKPRKSVRVLLDPTFSPTPPASEYIEDDNDDSGWRSRIPEPDEREENGTAVWEDSTDEDVEYKKARKLLKKGSKKRKGAKSAV